MELVEEFREFISRHPVSVLYVAEDACFLDAPKETKKFALNNRDMIKLLCSVIGIQPEDL